MAGQQGLHLSQERQVEEYGLCVDGLAGFIYWCETYARIEDKDTHRAIVFKLYACQKRIIKKVFKGEWLRILKARRLGVTWLFAAYAVWLMTFREMQTVGYLIHKKEYSEDFVDRCGFISARLPSWIRPGTTSENKREMDYKDTESWIRAMTATKGAADSVAADVVIVDEATKIEEKQAGLLGSILQSIEPTVETAKGTIVLIAKSEGPQGLFYKGWQASEKGEDKYTNVFLSWRARPGRTKEWYANEVAMHVADPLFMPRNYPASADEAFQQAEGRVYPTFHLATHVGRVLPDGNLVAETDQPLWVPDHWPKWRAVDWGGRHPFVCLWISRISKEGVRLTVDPACEKTIGEFMAYRYKPHTDYFEDKNNHACFAAGTMIDVPGGHRPIEEIVRGDVVQSHLGYASVIEASGTGVRPTVRLSLANGEFLVCTPDHPLQSFMDDGCWVAAEKAKDALLFVPDSFSSRLREQMMARCLREQEKFGAGSAYDPDHQRARVSWECVGRHVRVNEVMPSRTAPVYNLATSDGTYVAQGVDVCNCDALRYCIETMSLTKGHYHIYRELYLPNTADQGLELSDLSAMIRDLTGDEQISMTVADRSQPLSINAFQLHKIPCMANQHYLKEGSTRRGLITQGVRMVNTLLVGTGEFLPARVRATPSPEDAVTRPPSRVSVSLDEARLLRKKTEKGRSRTVARSRQRQMTTSSRRRGWR